MATYQEEKLIPILSSVSIEEYDEELLVTSKCSLSIVVEVPKEAYNEALWNKYIFVKRQGILKPNGEGESSYGYPVVHSWQKHPNPNDNVDFYERVADSNELSYVFLWFSGPNPGQ